MRKIIGITIKGLAVAAAIAFWPLTSAQAVPVNCLDTTDGGNGFSMATLEGQTASSCWTDSALAVNGDANETATINTLFQGAGEAFQLIGKSDGDAGFSDSGGTSGTFAIDLAKLSSYGEVVIYFETGQGRNSPYWAGFGIWDLSTIDPTVIAPSNQYNGTFNLTAWGQNGLSHISVFARGDSEPPCTENCEPPCEKDCEPPCEVNCDQVPEPAPLAIFGTGLLALGCGTVVARRRRENS